MSDFPATANRIIDDYLKNEPIQATIAGRHDYDAELPDITPDGFADSNTRAKAYLATLERFGDDVLTPDEQIDRALLASKFQVEVHDYEARQTYKHDPSLYPSLAVYGIYSLLMHDFAPLAQRIPAIEARLSGIPAMLAAGRKNLETSPAIWTSIAVEEAQGGIEFLKNDVANVCSTHQTLTRPLENAVNALADYA